MIKKLDNGTTLITLGEGTVFSGIARAGEENTPVGICFTNQKGVNMSPEEAVVIQIYNEQGVASYLMALMNLLDTWTDDKGSALAKNIEAIKKDLEKLVPKEAEK